MWIRVSCGSRPSLPTVLHSLLVVRQNNWADLGVWQGHAVMRDIDSIENGVGDVARRRWLGKVGWPREWHWKSCSFSPAPKVNPREPGAGFWEVLSLSWCLSAGLSWQLLLHLPCWERRGSQAKSGQRGVLTHRTPLLLPQLVLWCSLDKALYSACQGKPIPSGAALELLSLEIKYHFKNSLQSVCFVLNWALEDKITCTLYFIKMSTWL